MRKSRILIVDDEPGLLRLLTLNLEKMDRYEVLTVEDSTLVLEAVVNFKPDLVILDWIMPTIPGEEVAEQIGADCRIANTPILFFSAFIMKRDGHQEISGFPAIAKWCAPQPRVARIAFLNFAMYLLSGDIDRIQIIECFQLMSRGSIRTGHRGR